MTKAVEVSVIIDEALRFGLFGLECALGVEFYPKETARVFADALEDQMSAKKTYTFWEAPKLRVTGVVDEYEPETIHVIVQGRKVDNCVIEDIFQRAKYQVIRQEKAENISQPQDDSPD